MGVDGSACEENILNTIDPDLSGIYWFPHVVIDQP
jgi:hypothetical protein